MQQLIVRRAGLGDAKDACDVMRRSIRDLCTADHQHRADVLREWLGNKTPEFVTKLVTSRSGSCVVGTAEGTVCGFGQMHHTGEIGLLYVEPRARFSGVSTDMLQWLEDQARGLGLRRTFLSSTATAKPFYLARGYSMVEEPRIGFAGVEVFPMEKRFD